MSGTEKKHLILLVDDHPKVLRFIEIDLRIHGFDVLTTTSGKKAVELVRSAKPDIMLMDIIMPEMSGFEVLRELRAFTDLPVIAFSADPGNRDEAMYSGANYFMAKPFHPNEMVRRIETFLKQEHL